MVSEDRIRSEELTSDDVLERMTETPKQTVEWLPEWDDHAEERPGENTRIEDETLIWERDGFEARLESYETTHWRAEIDIPEAVGQYYPREIDLKCSRRPEHGFVESVDADDYVATQATLVIQDNYQPVWEVNAFIDMLLEAKESAESFQDELEGALEVAQEIEAEESE